MAHQGLRVDSGVACEGAYGENGGGKYFADVYYVNEDARVVRQRVQFPMLPYMRDPANVIQDAAERISRAVRRTVPVRRIGGVAVDRLCWNQEHASGLASQSDYATVERVGSFVVGDPDQRIDSLDVRTLVSPDTDGIGRIQYDVEGKPQESLVVYLPSTVEDQRLYPVRGLIRAAITGLPESTDAPYFALHGRQGGRYIERVVTADQLS